MPLLTLKPPRGEPISYRFEGPEIAVGRDADCDVVLHDPSVSRRHAVIRRVDPDWVLIDLGSANGTLLNGVRLSGAVPLAPGDRIVVGEDRSILVFSGESLAGGGDGSTRRSPPRAALGDEIDPLLVGRSPALQRVKDAVEKVADADLPVLITGESGTGKELLARLIHRLSGRAVERFVVVNCPAIPKELFEAELFGVERGVATGVEARPGLLESADRGTLLLDEVGDLEIGAQAKLLRFLQLRVLERLGGRKPRRLDVRVLAATNHDLEAAMAEGRFRRDLYHRLRVVAIAMPPLRERREDIALLAAHFLARPGPEVALSAEALDCLERYGFPGNVRELEALLAESRLYARGAGVIRPEHLPAALRAPARPEATAAGLPERLLAGESFWSAVYEPFIRREVPREVVLDLIRTTYTAAGHSYKKMAERFGITAPREYKRLLNFLHHHALGVRGREDG